MLNLLGDYELLELIGFGATGRVWRARHTGTGALVAIKELRGDLADDPEVRSRFLNEGSVLADRVLPGVVRVHKTVAEGERLGLVMDLVDGYDLRQLISAQGPQRPARACALVSQVAATLAVAHGDGLVHRDVKPENIMVVDSDSGTGAALLTDFGLARVLDETATTRTRSQVLGTPHYVAPEILRGGQAAAPADVYALGVVLFETILGWRPFRSPHPAALLQQHLGQVPLQPPQVNDTLWTIIAACLAKIPDKRPTALALAQQLDALAERLSGDPALPRTDPPTEQEITRIRERPSATAVTTGATERPPRRSRRWIATAAAGATVVALATYTSFGVATNTTREPTEATTARTDASPQVATPASPTGQGRGPASPTALPVQTTSPSADRSSSATNKAGEPPKSDATTSKNTPSNRSTSKGERSGAGRTESGKSSDNKTTSAETTAPDKSPTKTGQDKNAPTKTGQDKKTRTQTRPRANPNKMLYGICQFEVKNDTLSYRGSTYPTYKWSRCRVGSPSQVYALYKEPTAEATTRIMLYNRNFDFNSGYRQHQWSVAPASWSSWLREAGWGGNNGEAAPVLLGYGSTQRWSSSVSVQTWLKKGNPEKDNRNRYLQSWRQTADGRSLSDAGYRREWNPFYAPKS